MYVSLWFAIGFASDVRYDFSTAFYLLCSYWCCLGFSIRCCYIWLFRVCYRVRFRFPICCSTDFRVVFLFVSASSFALGFARSVSLWFAIGFAVDVLFAFSTVFQLCSYWFCFGFPLWGLLYMFLYGLL